MTATAVARKLFGCHAGTVRRRTMCTAHNVRAARAPSPCDAPLVAAGAGNYQMISYPYGGH
jgi:hypothetical protein